MLFWSGWTGPSWPHNCHTVERIAEIFGDFALEWPSVNLLVVTPDERFFGSLVIAPQDPVAAAEEIRRVGLHPRIVEVLICNATRTQFGQHPL